MNITVILCTYNRCRTLEKALSSVAVSTLPESIEWEVLVVDNNSRDQPSILRSGFQSFSKHTAQDADLLSGTSSILRQILLLNNSMSSSKNTT